MIRTLFVSLFIIMAVSISAQTKRYYCEVKGVEKELTSGLKSKQKLVDEKGEEIPFNSMVDAGNYLSDKGWTFVQAYTSVYGSQAIVHWIFVKEATSPEEAVKGIMTKDDYNKQKR